MTFLRRTLQNHPQIKRAIKSVAKSAGLFRDSPANDFYRELAEVKTRGDDAFSTLFYGYDGDHLINKWNHFLPIYSRLFAPYRNGMPDGRPLRFLEIGVYEGGSLDLWRRFFGESAILYGIDVDPRCAVFDGRAAQVRIGSQADPAFLRSVVAEMGGVDIVLDDGSHVASHQRVSFETLFPLLAEDGLYVAEDLHTSYWRDYEGGYRRKGHVPGDDQGVHRRHARLVSRPRRAGDRARHRRDPRLRQHRRLREGRRRAAVPHHHRHAAAGDRPGALSASPNEKSPRIRWDARALIRHVERLTSP